MGSDGIVNARVSALKNSAKKNRGSKQAKSKHNKVEVKNERNLCQVKNKEHNVEIRIIEKALYQSLPNDHEGLETQVDARKDEHKISKSYNNGSLIRSSVRYGLNSGCSSSCSSSCSEEDGDEECLDDWEAMADALAAENNKQISDVIPGTSAINSQYQQSSRAWSPDDVDRPRSLPSISKQQYIQNQLISEWGLSPCPSACPICCEGFDVTDLSFLPCPCGFRVCLFCHKKILEVDSRCPGCRKRYDSVDGDSVLAVQMNHSWSKNT